MPTSSGLGGTPLQKVPEEHPKLAAVHAHLRNLQVWYRWCSTELAENAQESPTPLGGREAQLGAKEGECMGNY
jgi:hypothetical protein